MKKFFTLVCTLTLPLMAFCQEPLPSYQPAVTTESTQPNAQPNQLITAPAPSTESQTLPAAVPSTSYKVALKIEPLSQEQIQAGITPDLLQSIVQKKLEESGISVDMTLQQPVLILRVRSIQTGLDVATFFQLSLQEDSMLVRNRSLFQAVTWSQASLLACRPEDLKKEVVETVDLMAQSFSKDYAKALQL